jgi:RNase P subunit RPR2
MARARYREIRHRRFTSLHSLASWTRPRRNRCRFADQTEPAMSARSVAHLYGNSSRRHCAESNTKLVIGANESTRVDTHREADEIHRGDARTRRLRPQAARAALRALSSVDCGGRPHVRRCGSRRWSAAHRRPGSSGGLRPEIQRVAPAALCTPLATATRPTSTRYHRGSGQGRQRGK